MHQAAQRHRRWRRNRSRTAIDRHRGLSLRSSWPVRQPDCARCRSKRCWHLAAIGPVCRVTADGSRRRGYRCAPLRRWHRSPRRCHCRRRQREPALGYGRQPAAREDRSQDLLHRSSAGRARSARAENWHSPMHHRYRLIESMPHFRRGLSGRMWPFDQCLAQAPGPEPWPFRRRSPRAPDQRNKGFWTLALQPLVAGGRTYPSAQYRQT